MRKIPSSSPALGLEWSDCKGAVVVHAGEGRSVPQVRLCRVDGGEGPVPGNAAEAGTTGLSGHGACTRGGVAGVPETG